MSCNWHVHCVECKETHRFDGANHLSTEMLLLCKHASAIAALADLMRESEWLRLELGSHWGSVDSAWFAKHRGHVLKPIDEYGRLLDQCHDYVTCSCGRRDSCTKSLGHDGEHEVRR